MICPRCDSDQAYRVHAADDASWEIYRCPQCNFNWRSTEAEELTDPKLYNPRFKLNERQIETFPPKPPIPPLKMPQGARR